MKQDSVDQLFKEFPNTFRNFGHISVRNGWLPLIKEIAKKIEPHAKTWWKSRSSVYLIVGKDHKIPCFISEIQEKHGRLSFKINPVLSNNISDFISQIENKSFTICETCGRLNK